MLVVVVPPDVQRVVIELDVIDIAQRDTGSVFR